MNQKKCENLNFVGFMHDNFHELCWRRCFTDLSSLFFIVAMLDMNISQFLKSLGLEHLRDIFEREQVSDSETHHLPNV